MQFQHGFATFLLSWTLQTMGSIYRSHPVGLLYFIGTWTLDPHLKWPLFFHVQMQIIQSQIKRLGSRTGSNDNRPGLSWMGEVWSITRNRHLPKQSKSTGEVFQNVSKFNQIYTKRKKKNLPIFFIERKTKFVIKKHWS